MSFSKNVKDELSRQVSTPRHCCIAELAAIINLCGSIRSSSGRMYLVIHTENGAVARKCYLLLQKTFHAEVQVLVRRNVFFKKNRMYVLQVRQQEAVKAMIAALHLKTGGGPFAEQGIFADELLLHNACCKRAALRGAFLSSGSISDPTKSYHMEIVCANNKKAVQIQNLLIDFNIEARIVLRKKYFVVYIKEGRQIVEALNVMEAHVALMDLENIRILKEIGESVNRQVNCETANIAKTVSAANVQIQDITVIREHMGLESLPEGLEEVALARLALPEASLQELGASLNPPVGKSGVNHRLRKLKDIADSIREGL